MHGGIEEYVVNSKASLLLNNKEINDFSSKNDIILSNGYEKELVSLLLTPLIIENQVVGTITIKSFSKHNKYSQFDTDLMNFVATQIANVLVNQKASIEIDKMKTAVNNSSSGLITSDLNGNVNFVNPTAINMWGYANNQIMLKDRPFLIDYFPKDKNSLIKMIIKKVYSSGENFLSNNGIICIKNNGKEFIAQLSISLIKDKQGNKTGITTSFIDITEKKKREINYRTILETMNEGVIKVDNKEKIQYVNDKFCHLSEYSRSELIGEDANTLFSANKLDSKGFTKKAKDRIEGKSEQYESLLKKKNGKNIWVSTSAAPIINEYNNIIGSIGILTDITKNKIAQESELRNKQIFEALGYSSTP